MPANHEDMARFASATDIGYQRISRDLESLIKEASLAVSEGKLPKKIGTSMKIFL